MRGPDHILLVEDEDNIAIAVELLLVRAGYHVTRVATGCQALPNLRALIPALVILDVTLPEMSGYEICQQLRRDPDLGRTPVLIMSARTSPAEQRKAMAMGADAFLAKPFATADLITAVHRLSKGTHP
ncbi:MAG: response regulator [Celeribacter marinus]